MTEAEITVPSGTWVRIAPDVEVWHNWGKPVTNTVEGWLTLGDSPQNDPYRMGTVLVRQRED